MTNWFIDTPLPDPKVLDARLKAEPIQVPTNKEQFNVTVGGIKYYIKPLYTYELYGLVVSRHTAGSTFSERAHRTWGDRINTTDLCVLWGKNAFSGIYREMKFWSGQWTCFGDAKDGNWGRLANQFDHAGFSNNHMLISGPRIAEMLNEIQIGDQIHFKGYLAEYGTDTHKIRSTSTTRLDTGQGACETVYTTDIQIIRRGGRTWNFWPWVGGAGLVLLFILWLFTPSKRIYQQEKELAHRSHDEDNSLYARQRRRRKE